MAPFSSQGVTSLAKRALDLPFPAVSLDPSGAEPLHRQLYFGVREAILDGRLRPGLRLPSSRVLAREIGVSRNTVLAAFEQLSAEGYLDGRVGAGSFVSRRLPEEALLARVPGQRRAGEPARPRAPRGVARSWRAWVTASGDRGRSPRACPSWSGFHSRNGPSCSRVAGARPSGSSWWGARRPATSRCVRRSPPLGIARGRCRPSR